MSDNKRRFTVSIEEMDGGFVVQAFMHIGARRVAGTAGWENLYSTLEDAQRGACDLINTIGRIPAVEPPGDPHAQTTD